MKNNIYIFIALFLINHTVSAQFRKGGNERIKALKIAYITEKLDLTSKEAAQFWPVYNAYHKKAKQLRHETMFLLKNKVKEIGGVDALSDKEAKEIVLRTNSIKSDLHKNTTKFYSKLNNIISYKKIIKLEIAERNFHRKLIRKLRGKRKREREK